MYTEHWITLKYLTYTGDTGELEQTVNYVCYSKLLLIRQPNNENEVHCNYHTVTNFCL